MFGIFTFLLWHLFDKRAELDLRSTKKHFSFQDHENSFDSVSTNITDVSTKQISTKSISTKPISTSRSDAMLVVEGQSSAATSGSDSNRGITTASTQVTSFALAP